MAFTIEPYENEKGFFIKAFLADDQFNSNDWRVDRAALERDHGSFVGRKFVLMANDDKSDYLHPEFEVQEDYASGPIFKTGFDEKLGKAFFEAKIEDPAAIEAIKSGRIKYVSSGMTATQWFKDDDGRTIITEFVGEHVAGVMRPAYGKYKAQIKGQCAGSYGECKQILMHVQACDGCKTVLASANNSHSSSDAHSKLIMGAPPENAGTDTSKPPKPATAQHDCPEGQKYSEAEGKCMEASATAELKTKVASQDKLIKDLTAKLEASEKKPIVARIVAARVELGEIKEDAKATEEESLMKQSVDSLTYIASLAESATKRAKATQENLATIPPQYRKHFQASEEGNTDEKAGDKFMLRMRSGD